MKKEFIDSLDKNIKFLTELKVKAEEGDVKIERVDNTISQRYDDKLKSIEISIDFY